MRKLIDFSSMKTRLIKLVNWRISLIPSFILLIVFLIQSYNYPLHDYSNSYFPALMAKEGIAPETIVFDIYDFNKYAWNKGYSEVFIDFYLNSPFTATFFYPLTLLPDGYDSKLAFNIISKLLFLWTIFLLLKKFPNLSYIGFLAPLVLIVSLRNNILFGQSYLLITFILVASFWLIEKRKHLSGISIFVLGVLIKIFPIYYTPILIFNKQWKSILYALPVALCLIWLSIITSGYGFWHQYLTQVLPNAIANESTIDFLFNSQSFEVFLKTLFVRDAYYNPNAPFNSYETYKIISFLIKGFLIGVLLSLSSIHKKNLFNLLSIWIVGFFILQSRTASYAQVLWVIPMFIYAANTASAKKIILFLVLLFVISNFPYHEFRNSHIILQFTRLWLSVLLAFMFFIQLGWKFNFKYWIVGFGLTFLVGFNSLFNKSDDPSSYVLNSKSQYFIYDFSSIDGHITYSSIDHGVSKQITTSFKVDFFDSTRCELINNQIYFDQKQITHDPSLKKKPILISECEVVYLTDRNSRRGTFTLKKMNVCNE